MLSCEILSDNSLLDPFLPGIKLECMASLWLTTSTYEFGSDEMLLLRRAVAPLHPVVWHGLPDLKGYPLIGSEPSSFAQFLMEGNLIIATTETTGQYNQKRHSVVAWASKEEALYGGGLRPEASRGAHTEFAFIPELPKTVAHWASLAQGFHWLWLCRNLLADAPSPTLEGHPIAIACLKAIENIGGIGSLVWQDSNMKNGLTLFASNTTLEGVLGRLQAQSGVETAPVFAPLVSTGFYFDMIM